MAKLKFEVILRFLMKQTSPQRYNYTVAKAVMDIVFDQNGGTEKHDAYVILCN